MAFKMSPIGKRKCPYSPLQKRGLINPSPVMNNSDEKKVSSSSSSYQKGKKLTEEQLKEKQAELQKKANETGESQSWSNLYSSGGSFDEVWKKMSEAEKAKHGNDFEKWKKKALEYNKKMSQFLNADPQLEPKKQIKQKAKPVYDNVVDYLRANKINIPFETSYTEEIQLPGGQYMNVKKKMSDEEIAKKIKEGYGSLYQQFRNATKNKDIEGGITTEIGRDGDEKDLEMNVAGQLDDKSKALNAEIVKSGG